MKKRINIGITAICWVICRLALTSMLTRPVTAQGCEDCEIIKKGVPTATAGAVTPAAIMPASSQPTVATSPTASVARLTLYWSEGCGHCHDILDSLLPSLQQKYGPQLEVRLIEVVSLEDVSAFFDLAEAYGYARGRASVPFLLIGGRALMGAEQIERELPGLVAAALTASGTDWTAPPVRDADSPAALADDICGFTTPCAADETATAALSSQQLRVLVAASVLVAALAIGGIFGPRRTRGRTGE